MQTKFFFVLAMLLLCQAQAAIYISPKGNDKAQGTKKAPLKNLTTAIKKASKQSDKKIILLDGFYELKKTITFTPKHSGIKIKAAHEGKAIISGSYSFTPKWKTYKNNILVCDLPEKLDLNKIKELFIKMCEVNKFYGDNLFQESTAFGVNTNVLSELLDDNRLLLTFIENERKKRHNDQTT